MSVATTIPRPFRTKLNDNSITLLKKRYLQPGETIDGMFRRVADGNDDYYRLMSDLDFLPNTPTLVNKGVPGRKGTLSACFHFVVADSMFGPDSIVETRNKATAVAKWGGGVGYYFGNLRPKNSPVNSTHRVACGPVKVLIDYHGIDSLITQGGVRALAQMGIMPTDHPDIREFIHVKDNNPDSLSSFNISCSARNKFMNLALTPGDHAERQLWMEIGDSAWMTGDPGIYFHDTVNATNPTPWLGDLMGTNPCGEVPLLNNEPCNLGSISICNFVTPNRTIDFDRLEYVVRTSTRFLDHILDCNHFPHPDIEAAALLTRKLGLGVMGWADALCLMHVNYDTEKATGLAEELMSFIDGVSADESLKLGRRKGPYSGSEGNDAHRNGTRTCIAPTGSIATIARCSSSIEPHYSLDHDREMGDGTILHEKPDVIDAADGFTPKTAMEIDWRWHVRHQAAFQKYTNLACSKTINLPQSASVDDIRSAYEMMWRLGCKGGTVYRDKCREKQVLRTKSTETVVMGNGHHNGNGVGKLTIIDEPTNTKEHGRRKLPKTRKSITHDVRIGDAKIYVHVGMYSDDTPGEVFITCAKEGSTISGLIDWACTCMSFALQAGIPLRTMIKKFSDMRFEPCGMTNNKEIPICTSIPDYVVRWLDLNFGGHKDEADGKIYSGMLCPECHGKTIFQSGCLTCASQRCSWSKCG